MLTKSIVQFNQKDESDIFSYSCFCALGFCRTTLVRKALHTGAASTIFFLIISDRGE
jgi:hypothetical protein